MNEVKKKIEKTIKSLQELLEKSIEESAIANSDMVTAIEGKIRGLSCALFLLERKDQEQKQMSSFLMDIKAKRNVNYRQVNCCLNCKHYDDEKSDYNCTAFLKECVLFMRVSPDCICDKYIEAEL